ncbi:hypothetical protein EVD33_13525 [Bacteroidales bacterium SW292]|nr:hypothetical protein [Bacteroidales bacterium SW292]
MKRIYPYFRELLKLLGIRTFFPTLFFNFYYLPFHQAIRLPIWVHRLHLTDFRKGKIKIEVSSIKPGMIRLGFFGGHMYPNNGIHIWNKGTLIFKGSCRIGNNSFIVVGKQGYICFGDDFVASTSIKLISFVEMEFGNHTRLGWECIVMNTNFHPLYDMEKERFKKAYGPIYIGDNNWFGTQCLVMHSVQTPKRCIFGARSVVTRGKYESYCVYGGSPIHVLTRNVKRIIGQDLIDKYILDDSFKS